MKLLEAMDAAEEANRAKSQFLANISHEVRTPLNGIIGFLDLLSKTPLDSVQKDYVKEINNSSELLLNLINDLLDFSKIEAKKIELEKIDFNLRKAMEEVISMFALKTYSKGVELYALIDNAVPDFVNGDPGKLKQIMVNLISNAVKFTGNGRVTVTIKPVSQTADKLTLLFQVMDTGIGIAENEIQKLFEPFKQADASTTRKYGGTGLGLSISKRLIEMMSGQINVESKLGKGSTFSFLISFDKTAASSKKKGNPEADLQGIRILIADQSEENRQIVRHYLEAAGCLVEEADNSVKAIEILREEALHNKKIKITLLSDKFPDISGLELAAGIKADDLIKDTLINLFTYYANPCSKKTSETKGISE
jgi:CheY-like chemotaxis protein